MASDIVVEIVLFARVRELCGNKGHISVQVADGGTPIECFEMLCERFPGVRKLRSTLVVAINEEYSDWDHVLCEGDVISFIPPVSGG